MTKCPIPRCLGHARERTEAVPCTRCGGPRWVLLPLDAPSPSSYTCHRCRLVLAGANAIDPRAEAASPAQRAARAQSAERLGKARSAGQEPADARRKGPRIPSGGDA
jgi:hypothetical protein